MTQPAFPIYLLRHGETEWNAEKRLQGSMDSPVTPRGIKQAKAMAEVLQARLDRSLDWRLVSSPLKRAESTATIIAAHCRVALTLDPNLREISLGSWNGMTWAEIERAHPGASTRRGRDFHSVNGENYDQVTARAQAWLKSLTGPTIAVSHAIIGQVIRGLYLGQPDSRAQPDHRSQQGLYLLAGGTAEFIECAP